MQQLGTFGTIVLTAALITSCGGGTSDVSTDNFSDSYTPKTFSEETPATQPLRPTPSVQYIPPETQPLRPAPSVQYIPPATQPLRPAPQYVAPPAGSTSAPSNLPYQRAWQDSNDFAAGASRELDSIMMEAQQWEQQNPGGSNTGALDLQLEAGRAAGNIRNKVRQSNNDLMLRNSGNNTLNNAAQTEIEAGSYDNQY